MFDVAVHVLACRHTSNEHLWCSRAYVLLARVCPIVNITQAKEAYNVLGWSVYTFDKRVTM